MINVTRWKDDAWRLNCLLLGLPRPVFEQIETVQDFEDMLTGALHRYQLAQDLIGHLRVDVMRAAGVTFSDRPHQPKPGQKVPTFELLMGRPPIDPLGRTAEQLQAAPEPKELPDSLKGLTREERMAKAAKAQAAVAAVQARKAMKHTAKMG